MDVNERVISEWIEEATPAERVREVMTHTYESTTTAKVADAAHVPEGNTREHLHDLEAEGFVDCVDRGWRRNEVSLIDEQARDITERVDRETLVHEVERMEAQNEPDETTRRNLVFARAALDLYRGDEP